MKTVSRCWIRPGSHLIQGDRPWETGARQLTLDGAAPEENSECHHPFPECHPPQHMPPWIWGKEGHLLIFQWPFLTACPRWLAPRSLATHSLARSSPFSFSSYLSLIFFLFVSFSLFFSLCISKLAPECEEDNSAVLLTTYRSQGRVFHTDDVQWCTDCGQRELQLWGHCVNCKKTKREHHAKGRWRGTKAEPLHHHYNTRALCLGGITFV